MDWSRNIIQNYVFAAFGVICFLINGVLGERCNGYYLGRSSWSHPCYYYCCGNLTYKYCCNDCHRSIYPPSMWCSAGNALGIVIGCAFGLLILATAIVIFVSCCKGCCDSCRRRWRNWSQSRRGTHTHSVQPMEDIATISGSHIRPGAHMSYPKPVGEPPSYDECDIVPPPFDAPGTSRTSLRRHSSRSRSIPSTPPPPYPGLLRDEAMETSETLNQEANQIEASSSPSNQNSTNSSPANQQANQNDVTSSPANQSGGEYNRAFDHDTE